MSPDPAPDPWADPARFGQAFQAFLEAFVYTAERPSSDLSGLVEGHLGVDPLAAPVISRVYPAYQLASLHLGVGSYIDGQDLSRVLGISGPGREYRSLTELLTEGGVSGFRSAAVEYRAVTVGVEEEMTCVSCALWLVKHRSAAGGPVEQCGDADGARENGRQVPVAVLLRADDPNDPDGGIKLDVMAADAVVAAEVIAAIEAATVQHDVLRGKVMSIQPHGLGEGLGPMRFHRRPHVTIDDLVLPDGLLDLVERQVVGIAKHRDLLRSRGQHLRRGVLLHGPPGTGKTLTIRYLLGHAEDFTILLITGPAIRHLAAACDLARRLQPAMVVIEDVDLVAEDRMMVEGPQPLLFQMLDELDGLEDDADVAFVLTTNRVGVLERALVERPGRIDVVVEVPLPDAAGRRRLFRLYGAALEVSEADLDDAADACPGVTASFVKECVRRAVLISAERGSSHTERQDLQQGMDELLASREEVSGRLLGAQSQHSSADLGGYC
ncbi:MAG: cell division protease FtsH [Actinomycetota bacterium]|nr:cell division protease FtsH [Actinomycetota bacterium]